MKKTSPARAADIKDFIGAERFEKLVKQAEPLGFTPETLLAAAFDRTPADLTGERRIAVAAIHLARLAGSAPSREDRAKLKALTSPEQPAPSNPPAEANHRKSSSDQSAI